MASGLVDGRAVALEDWPAFAPHLIASGSRAQRGKLLAQEGEYLFGVWSAEANITTYLDYPCHELMAILEGTVTVITEHATHTYGPGDVWVLPMHARVVWGQTGPVRKFFVAVTDGWVRQGGALAPSLLSNAGDAWKAGRLAVECRQVKKGERVGGAAAHVVVHLVASNGVTYFGSRAQPVVMDRDALAVVCTYDASPVASL